MVLGDIGDTACGAVCIGDRLPHWIVSIVMLVVVVFLTVSICSLINNRTDIAGDQWLIPGMDTPEKGACLSGAITLHSILGAFDSGGDSRSLLRQV